MNAEWFTTTKQAQIVINHWLRQYNRMHPCQVLNMRPPVPVTLTRNGPQPRGWTPRAEVSCGAEKTPTESSLPCRRRTLSMSG
ncbi:hypothetical protein C1J02_07445 [Sulfitobacter sp. SK011]|nr:hypothetical protein C1J02_07445 [Sulfitobacter sp. SK011]